MLICLSGMAIDVKCKAKVQFTELIRMQGDGQCFQIKNGCSDGILYTNGIYKSLSDVQTLCSKVFCFFLENSYYSIRLIFATVLYLYNTTNNTVKPLTLTKHDLLTSEGGCRIWMQGTRRRWYVITRKSPNCLRVWAKPTHRYYSLPSIE